MRRIGWLLPCLLAALVSSAAESSCPGRRPNVALCLAGAARTFAYDAVVGRLRRNLVDAYGASITTVRARAALPSVLARFE